MSWFKRAFSSADDFLRKGVNEATSAAAARGAREAAEAGIREGAEEAAERLIANQTKNAIQDTVAEAVEKAAKETVFQPVQGKGAWKTAFFGSKYVQMGGAAAITATGVATAVAVGRSGDEVLEGFGDSLKGAGTLMEYAPLAIGAGVAIIGIYYLTSS